MTQVTLFSNKVSILAIITVVTLVAANNMDDMSLTNIFASTPIQSTPKTTNPFSSEQSHGDRVARANSPTWPSVSTTNPFMEPTTPKNPFNPFQNENVYTPDNNHNPFSRFSSSKSTKFRRPVKLPDDYDGRLSLRDYLTHFNRCAIVNEWNEEESAIFLSASPRGEAQKLLHGMPESDCRDYRKLVARLETCFGAESRQELHQVRLNNRQQQEGESLRSLAVDIQDLCSLAYQDLPPAAQERFCVQHFIDAIADRDDRMKLRRDKPKSLDTALALACELEAFKQMENNLRKPAQKLIRSEKVNKPQEARQETTDASQLDDIRLQQETQQKQLHELSALLQKLVSDDNKKENTSKSQTAHPTRVQETKQVECWFCKAKGHLRRDCPSWET